MILRDHSLCSLHEQVMKLKLRKWEYYVVFKHVDRAREGHDVTLLVLIMKLSGRTVVFKQVDRTREGHDVVQCDTSSSSSR